ncbi:hypothetical protein HMPREF9120_01822 [Neisseria sp. oral taxon 020 str. F0370]|nr:hypothetical protein HMPREF9120_01822 [Neisseria sp. oral taxon 020 str. F0370]
MKNSGRLSRVNFQTAFVCTGAILNKIFRNHKPPHKIGEKPTQQAASALFSACGARFC